MMRARWWTPPSSSTTPSASWGTTPWSPTATRLTPSGTGLLEGKVFAQSLRTREFEPDPDNYTPRISGLLHKDGSYALSILKSNDGDPSCCCRYFFGYDHPKAGEGRFIHTYQENLDPLPSFEGEPRKVAVTAPDAKTLADELWASLNEDNKVSLFVQYVDLASGERDTGIINKHQ